MPAKRPNFLVILADDLGFSDVGCFGSEIKTPNLDKLAKKGVRFTNYHTASACSPTRSMVLSGTDNHIAGVGAMIEHLNDPYAEEMWVGKPGHQGYLVTSVAALPEVLQDAGYHTIMSGKWHLGREKELIPAARGFDKSYVCLPGCHNHYAYEPQFQSHDPDKDILGNWVKGMVTHENMYCRDHDFIQANHPKEKDGFFSTVTFTNELLQYLSERQSSPELKEKPFFAYYTFTAPHWPLHADKARRDVYKGKYDDGPAALRLRRLEALKKLGMIPDDVIAHEMTNPLKLPMWDEMNAEQKAMSARAMETFAAMVEEMDENIGKVLDQLEKDGELDNTFVLFMSDNGAEGASYEAYPVLGPSLGRTIKKYYNNSLDNIGEPDSFVWYGGFWAQAATAPSWLYKMYTSQGGIRVPMILHYPPMAHKSGTIVDPFTTCMDLMPTILELAGAKHPVPAGQGLNGGMSVQYRGRSIEHNMRGTSWVPWMTGKGDFVHSDGVPTGWELHGRAAMRIGDWKILYIPPPQGPGEWQLFNIRSDPGETTDLRSSDTAKFDELTKAWDHYVETTQVVWGDPTGAGEEIVYNGEDETDDPKVWMSGDLASQMKGAVRVGGKARPLL